MGQFSQAGQLVFAPLGIRARFSFLSSQTGLKTTSLPAVVDERRLSNEYTPRLEALYAIDGVQEWQICRYHQGGCW